MISGMISVHSPAPVLKEYYTERKTIRNLSENIKFYSQNAKMERKGKLAI